MNMISILQNLIYIYSKILHRKKHLYFLKFISKLSKIKKANCVCTFKKKNININVKNLKDYYNINNDFRFSPKSSNSNLNKKNFSIHIQIVQVLVNLNIFIMEMKMEIILHTILLVILIK